MEDFPALAGWISRLSWRHHGRAQLGFRPLPGKGGHVAREDGLALGRSTTEPPAGVGRKDLVGLSDSAAAASMPPTGANTPALVSRQSWRPDLGTASNFGAGAAGEAAQIQAANERWAQALSGDGAATAAAAGKKGSAASARAGAGGCKIVVWTQADGFAARGNSVGGFVEINRAVSRIAGRREIPRL